MQVCCEKQRKGKEMCRRDAEDGMRNGVVRSLSREGKSLSREEKSLSR